MFGIALGLLALFVAGVAIWRLRAERGELRRLVESSSDGASVLDRAHDLEVAMRAFNQWLASSGEQRPQPSPEGGREIVARSSQTRVAARSHEPSAAVAEYWREGAQRTYIARAFAEWLARTSAGDREQDQTSRMNYEQLISVLVFCNFDSDHAYLGDMLYGLSDPGLAAAPPVTAYGKFLQRDRNLWCYGDPFSHKSIHEKRLKPKKLAIEGSESDRRFWEIVSAER